MAETGLIFSERINIYCELPGILIADLPGIFLLNILVIIIISFYQNNKVLLLIAVVKSALFCGITFNLNWHYL